ncbi:MAG TPA: geranylgeranylglycerol-phosphate geranylgeranyltransferase [Bacteroidia bacterium]|nr:geranylgeranylglycerol-phosphate geranylgeranyltransferase [Bacteroidia bacterium]MBP7714349.1 geranylgeranylglycerol-phosphate geranylgeranyltransferase [Bacteroidia bacterium]MBP8668861.1 geranylgeranylglycerol-phosphate geranylgeranyltransferase [Bacteroidia bacterium]HOZ89492.1 geranylgeranylglycerol-phosphate geranylgeranyltransferase [Bacteroidia bacterium]HQW17632.1 geranylgeranylglycerol-phosphate geranylgeranyltransferase [Bacteroidia bacterium]
MGFLRLIRFPNLIILALAQCLIYYMIVVPLLKTSEFTPSLHTWQFLLVVLSTVFIAAGGYTINDFFDKDIDAANGIGKVHDFSGWTLKTFYFVFSIMGIAVGLYLTYALKLRQFALTYLLTAALLYFYSASYKRLPLVGNFVVAFLTAVAVFLPAFADYELQYAFRDIKLPVINNKMYNLRLIIAITAAYAFFAFLISLVREVIKDMEDIDGDREFGCNTLPIVAGINNAKLISIGLLLLIFGLILFLQIKQSWWESLPVFGYTILFVQVPLLILAVKLYFSAEKKHFKVASMIAKIVMVGGILSLPVFKYFST